jgi:hypothetical protein
LHITMSGQHPEAWTILVLLILTIITMPSFKVPFASNNFITVTTL